MAEEDAIKLTEKVQNGLDLSFVQDESELAAKLQDIFKQRFSPNQLREILSGNGSFDASSYGITLPEAPEGLRTKGINPQDPEHVQGNTPSVVFEAQAAVALFLQRAKEYLRPAPPKLLSDDSTDMESAYTANLNAVEEMASTLVGWENGPYPSEVMSKIKQLIEPKLAVIYGEEHTAKELELITLLFDPTKPVDVARIDRSRNIVQQRFDIIIDCLGDAFSDPVVNTRIPSALAGARQADNRPVHHYEDLNRKFHANLGKIAYIDSKFDIKTGQVPTPTVIS
jgi:hypothetical protein